MTTDSLAFEVARTLRQGGIDYMLVGSYASNQYGIPRATKDADFVIDFPEKGIDQLASLFRGDWNLDPQISFESITGSRKLELRRSGTEFVVELFFLTEDPHHVVRWERRVNEFVGEEQFMFPSAEDVIIQKLRRGRPKDLEDVTAVLSVQAGRLDYPYIEQWCKAHDTLDRLIAIRAQLPPDLGGTAEPGASP